MSAVTPKAADVPATTPTSGPGTFPHGIHPPEHKDLSEGTRIEVLEAPAKVAVPLLQHTGAPCTPTGKPRTEVAVGDKIGDAEAFVSAPIHSPLAGKTAKPGKATLPNGRHVDAIPVKADGEQPSAEEIRERCFGCDLDALDSERYSPEEIVRGVREGGLVGLGGAAFPTHVKLSPPPEKKIDTLLVNGCECEPYLNADNRVMIEAPEAVVAGALLAGRAVGAGHILVGVEDNKPEAIRALRAACQRTNVRIVQVATKYPQGGEKQLIRSTLGRTVPTGGLPLDVGVVVMNVGTSAAVYQAVVHGRPLTHRVVSVTGRGIREPKNLLVPVGVSYSALIAACGGLTDDATRAIAGGPMMGFAVGDLEAPVTKGTSGLLVMTSQEASLREETPCVRCGRCVDVCPLNLVPTKIALAARHRDWDLARRYHMDACMECGCCAYSCPAALPLVQLIRVGKASIPRD
jgi:electron transport complex protein RnfC